MQLNQFFQKNGDSIAYTREQASKFAKQIAGDFNPIHDADAKMFCVPGDLLFATVLHEYGLSQKMRFSFTGMVSENRHLNFAANNAERLDIQDADGKTFLSVERQGDITHDKKLIAQLSQAYVAFSGQTFPHILVPLMAEHKVMINVSRPLVVYESMVIELNTLDFKEPRLELADAAMDVDGKRGKAHLNFHIFADNQLVGEGQKNMVLSGLREFDQEQINTLIDFYNGRKYA